MKNNKSLEHLNVLLRIFFVSGVFQNFDVDYWPLLKAEKVLARKQFWRKFFFLSKFSFLLSIWIYKLSASRITQNSSHCYILNHNLGVPFQKIINYLYQSSDIVIFLGNNEENRFADFLQKGPIERFDELWFLDTRMGKKRSHKPLFLGIFKNRDFF